MPVDKAAKTPKTKKRTSAPKKKKTKSSSKPKAKHSAISKTSADDNITSTTKTGATFRSKGNIESSKESLRWWGQLADPQQEANRIDLYKERRRDRYYRKAAEESRELAATCETTRTSDIRPRRTYYYQSTPSVKMPNIYASPSAGTLCTTTAIQPSISQLSTITC